MNIILAKAPEIRNPALSNKIQKMRGIPFINLFIPNIITLFFIGATVASLFILLVGGIKWITSGGDKTATESAQKTITSAVIGLVIVFSVYAILRLLELILGLKLLVFDLGPLILRK